VFEIADQEYANWMTEWFCGVDKICFQRDEQALARAKDNLLNFSVVGLLEDLNGTFKLLERQLPNYFNGIFQYFFERDFHEHRTSKRWPRPNDQTVAFLRQRNLYDVELYNWVLERHEKVVKELANDWEPPNKSRLEVAKKSHMSLCFNLEADCAGPQ